MNFVCTDCHQSFPFRQMANESKTYVSGTASTRVRSVQRYCSECHAANEYKRHQAIQTNVDEVLASLTPEQRESYLKRRAERQAAMDRWPGSPDAIQLELESKRRRPGSEGW